MSAQPYTREEIEFVRDGGVLKEGGWSFPDGAKSRWLATLDARAAELAALKADLDVAHRNAAENGNAAARAEAKIAEMRAALKAAKKLLKKGNLDDDSGAVEFDAETARGVLATIERVLGGEAKS